MPRCLGYGILRDHTPDPDSSGKRWSELHGDMQRSAEMIGPRSRTACYEVTTLSEVPCRVSSDVHEWCNDWGTVSTTDSVK